MALTRPPSSTAPTKAPAPTYLLPPDFEEFAERAGYHAEPDGRVYTLKGDTKSYVPPWIVWQNSSTGKAEDGKLTPEGFSYRIPGSDPSSAWHFMYEQSGPFRKGSQWDDKEGTYKGSIDWLTLIGTIAAGGVIAAGAAAALSGGSAAAGAAPALEGTAAGPGAATTAAGLGTAPIAAETGATVGLTSGAGLPGAVAPLASSSLAPAAAALPAVASSGAVPAAVTTGAAASTPGILSKSLSALTTPAVLSTIAQGAFGVYAANKAAEGQDTSAKIIADAQLAAAKLQADASTEAAKIQAKSTADALDFAKSGYNNEIGAYNENQKQLSPYTGAGGAAVTKLSQLLGLGTPSSNVTPLPTVPVGAPPVPAQTGAQSMARPGTAAQQASADAFVPNAVRNDPNLAAVPQGPGPNAGRLSSLAPPTDTVMLRAPTGEVAPKPASEAPHWIALGAQPVQQGATA